MTPAASVLCCIPSGRAPSSCTSRSVNKPFHTEPGHFSMAVSVLGPGVSESGQGACESSFLVCHSPLGLGDASPIPALVVFKARYYGEVPLSGAGLKIGVPMWGGSPSLLGEKFPACEWSIPSPLIGGCPAC
uniref:Uncharacterized protein n=1 Tax=Molossus molossus TaxID=27622 RepID=A0A7J8E2T3_MOLMO|nr:hypothetical protein HJG59_009003 [Molossus molossus]